MINFVNFSLLSLLINDKWNFKVKFQSEISLVIASHLGVPLWRIAYENWLTAKLISECKPNSSFSANHRDNENDGDNENHSDNKNEGNYPGNKYMFKVNNQACPSLFDVDFENVIVHKVVFVFDSFFEQDHLLNLKKDDLNVHVSFKTVTEEHSIG